MSNSFSAHSIPHNLQVPTKSLHMMILVFLLVNVLFHRPPLPRAQSLLLCKGKAPAGSTQPRGGRKRGGAGPCAGLGAGPGHGVPVAWITFITSTCCCCSCVRHASTSSRSAGQLGKKKRHWEQSLQCTSLYNLQYIWNYLRKFTLLWYLLTEEDCNFFRKILKAFILLNQVWKEGNK